MKKFIGILICISLLSCLSIDLYSQTAQEELNQVELLKLCSGTWEWKIGGDSVQQIIYTPAGEGMLFKLVYKSGNKIYAEGGGAIGFSPDRKTIECTVLWPNGLVTYDIGRFVTEKKMVTERFVSGSPTHAVMLTEWNYSTPNSIEVLIRARGQNITWEPPGQMNVKYTKID